MNRVLPLAGALALSTLCAPAGAFPSAELVYVRAEGAERCPSEMELRLAVAHRLGYDPFHSGSRRRVLVWLERDGEHLIARFDLVSEQGMAEGERRLEGSSADCADLVRGLALSLSIAIDPEHAEAPSNEPPSAWRFQSLAATPAREDRLADEKDPVEPSAGPHLRFRIGLGGQAVYGVAPALAWGGLLAVSLRGSALSLGLEGRLDGAASANLRQGGRVSSNLASATLAPCFHFEPGLVCALGALGSISASSEGIAKPKTDQGLYAAAGLRVGTEWPLDDRFTLRTHVDALASFTRAQIAVDGRAVWQAPPYSAGAGVALLVRFP